MLDIVIPLSKGHWLYFYGNHVSEILNLCLIRYIFWVDCCEDPHIGRIGMDGSDYAVIINTEVYNPVALTIDYTNKRIYWADGNHIMLANMDGSQRHKSK